MLFFPVGRPGPAFLLSENFFVLKAYNFSDSYAFAASVLAERIAGRPVLREKWPAEANPLDQAEREAIQRGLTARGLLRRQDRRAFRAGDAAGDPRLPAQGGRRQGRRLSVAGGAGAAERALNKARRPALASTRVFEDAGWTRGLFGRALHRRDTCNARHWRRAPRRRSTARRECAGPTRHRPAPRPDGRYGRRHGPGSG